jgi:hypothetical protein
LHARDRVLVENPKTKRPLVRLRHRFDDNIKKSVLEVNYLVQDRDQQSAVAGTVRNLLVQCVVWNLTS